MEEKPNLYYSCINGVPFDNFCSDAAIGAHNSGHEVHKFEDVSEVPYNPFNIVVASVEDTQKYLGKEIPTIDHSWATEFLKRKSTRINSIEDIKEYPCFIKPEKDIKAFTGFVASNYEDAKRNSYSYEGSILKQDVINIESEYRVYVSSYRGILGVKHYLGDPYLSLDKDFVEKCHRKSQDHLTEKSYTLDFGIDDKGETFLIEVNDGWAIGNYGLDPDYYYHFVKIRFLQLTGILR